jgi:D-alanine-D-alanine ligase
MRVLILHSPVLKNASPDDLDTLVQAKAVKAALQRLGYSVTNAPFHSHPERLAELVRKARPSLIFNLVESIWGRGAFAAVALQAIERTGIPVTGGSASSMATTGDKVLAKTNLVRAGLPTPDWAEGPSWTGLERHKKWIVKAADEDASLGIDDDALVEGYSAVLSRAEYCFARYGCRWFAEQYIDGREFNVSLLRFEDWSPNRPRIVGYNAKWDEEDDTFLNTVRSFDWVDNEPELNATLTRLSRECWNLFDCRGYARVDYRVDSGGQPYILEINTNPSLEPGSGLAAAANEAELTYDELIEHICRIALENEAKRFSKHRNAS